MYTSGTTGDPKGVLISNESIITLLAGVKRLLESVNEQVCCFLHYTRKYIHFILRFGILNAYIAILSLTHSLLPFSFFAVE